MRNLVSSACLQYFLVFFIQHPTATLTVKYKTISERDEQEKDHYEDDLCTSQRKGAKNITTAFIDTEADISIHNRIPSN